MLSNEAVVIFPGSSSQTVVAALWTSLASQRQSNVWLWKDPDLVWRKMTVDKPKGDAWFIGIIDKVVFDNFAESYAAVRRSPPLPSLFQESCIRLLQQHLLRSDWVFDDNEGFLRKHS